MYMENFALIENVKGERCKEKDCTGIDDGSFYVLPYVFGLAERLPE